MTRAVQESDERAPRVGMVSLGCPKNRVDTEVMLGHLLDDGHVLTDDLDDADTVIVNTCGFIDEARQESIDTILDLAGRKETTGGRLVVAGCMVNRHGADLQREIPEIDSVVSLDELREVSSLVQLGSGATSSSLLESRRLFDHRDPRALTTPGFAYLKVAEGCDNPCTFCAIPQWRGRFRSRSVDSLVAEARALEERGVRELCLVAQDTTRYGEDLGLGRHGLLRCVEALLEATEFPWIRFLYAYPTTLDDELLRLMGREERFCSYIDMPLQHSHPEMLRAMRRGGSRSRYLRLVDRAREVSGNVFLRSTFIVGFPGETEEHFEDLLDFLDEARFDHLGAFAYSPEEGTPAAGLDAPVDRAVALERQSRLLERQRPIALASRRRLLGQRIETLVEGVCDETEHLLQGRHRGMAPEIDGRLLIADGVAAPGDLVDVEIVEAHADDLVGHIVEEGCR